MKSNVIVALALAVLGAGETRGTIQLNSGATHATFGAAVLAATNGDTLRISAGTYPATVVVSNKDLILAGGYNGTFTARDGGDTVVDGQLLGTTLWIMDASCRVDRVSFTGGTGAPENLWCGGGVLLHRSRVEFVDCGIYSNTASFGGGLFVGQFSYAMLTGVTEVYSNTATWSGGGIFSDGRCDLVHSNIVIRGNTAGAGPGGGIWVESGYLRLFQGRVAENLALPGAGGVPAIGGGIGASGSFVEIGDGAVLWQNEAACGGGLALVNSTGHLGRARPTDCYLGVNTATARGGGLYASNTTIWARGLDCWGNEAIEAGGGAWLHSCTVDSDVNGVIITQSRTEGHGGGAYLENTTARVSRLILGDAHPISGNQAGGHGGGLYATNSRIEMSGGLFQNNTALNPLGLPGSGHGGGAALFNSTMIVTNALDYADGYETPRFLQNHASINSGRGGAAYVGPGSTLQTYDTEFSENSAYAGGAIQAEDANTEFVRTTFISNEAEQDGGGFGLTASLALLTACRLEQNRALHGNGGGVWAESAPGLQIASSHLVGNAASNRGGGVYAYDSAILVYVAAPSYYTVADGWPLLLQNNEAYEGGAMMLRYCEAIVSHAALVANRAPAYASGLWVQGGRTQIAQSLITAGTQPAGWGGLPGAAICFAGPVTGEVLFCTVADNGGDGLRLFNEIQVAVSNSIIRENGSWNINTNGLTGGTFLVRHSDIGGGWPGTGNLDADPAFYPNHHLRHGSPCINAGGALAGLAWPNNPDMDGESRLADVPDMGFDEFRDGDGDRMPDIVETHTGKHVDEVDMGTDPADPDSDGDRVPDGDEWVADTDPLNGADYLRIVTFANAGPHQQVVTVVGGVAANLLLDVCTNGLAQGGWTNVAHLAPPVARTNEFWLSSPAGPSAVTAYRARAFRP